MEVSNIASGSQGLLTLLSEIIPSRFGGSLGMPGSPSEFSHVQGKHPNSELLPQPQILYFMQRVNFQITEKAKNQRQATYSRSKENNANNVNILSTFYCLQNVIKW